MNSIEQSYRSFAVAAQGVHRSHFCPMTWPARYRVAGLIWGLGLIACSSAPTDEGQDAAPNGAAGATEPSADTRRERTSDSCAEAKARALAKARAARKEQAYSCARIAIVPLAGTSARAADISAMRAPLTAASKFPSVPDWCGPADGWPVSRTQWCLSMTAKYYDILTDEKGRETEVGALTTTVTQWMTTDYKSQRLNIYVKHHVDAKWGTWEVGQIHPVMGVGYLPPSAWSVTPAEAWITPTEGMDYDYTYTLNGAASAVERYVTVLRQYAFAPSTGMQNTDFLQTPNIRCDNVLAQTPSGGCVLEYYKPRFWQKLSDPAVAPAVAVDYEVWSPYSIGKNGGTPLHRTTNQDVIKANRDVSCPRSWPRPAGMSCDEYPYASTYEGAASGGHWFSQMIDAKANSTQGSRLGTFYLQNRVLDGDGFYVVIEN